MLIQVPEHSPTDLDHWCAAERADEILSRSRRFRNRVPVAESSVAAFAADGPCYCGVSWGKDSVVVADIVVRLGLKRVPLVWVRVEPVANPHCNLVRDAFLRSHDHPYEEIVVEWDPNVPTGTLTSGRGFAEAARRYGQRYISGIRADESAGRAMRCRAHGTTSPNTCAPLAWWSSQDVFAYLHARSLPVHPAYAMTMGGSLDRLRLRVAALGGRRGTGMGRQEWEERYYRDRLIEIGLYSRVRS